MWVPKFKDTKSKVKMTQVYVLKSNEDPYMGGGSGGPFHVNPDYIIILVIQISHGFLHGSLTDDLLMWWFCKVSSWYPGIEDLTITNH